MQRKKHILVVDDETSIQDFIRKNLELRSFQVTVAASGLEALDAFHKEDISLIILDIMMPRVDGLEVCRRIRERSTVPIIMLTALGEESDKILALDNGADDYLTKPFAIGELLARVRAVTRRQQWSDAPPALQVKRYGNLEIDFEQRQVSRDGVLVKMSPTEFQLLQVLVLNCGRVCTHEALLRQVWGPEYREESEYVRIYIGRLRRKLEANPAHPIHFLTESGIGYYFQK